MTREDPSIDKNLRVGGARWRDPNSKRERKLRAQDKRLGRRVRRRREKAPEDDGEETEDRQ
jgi:hypothetical protein